MAAQGACAVLLAIFYLQLADCKHVLMPNVPMHARGPRPGWLLSSNPVAGAQSLEIFLGPFCEDSRAFWPTLKKVSR